MQQKLLQLVTAGSILIGHGLDSDFKALKLIHKHVIDSAYLYPHKRGLPYKRALRNLASTILGKIIQNSGKHWAQIVLFKNKIFYRTRWP